MRAKLYRRACTLALLPSLSLCTAVARADYTVDDLYTLVAPTGMTFPSVSTLNPISNGQVVGFGSVPDTSLQGILWTADGTAVPLRPSTSYTETIINGISGSQQVGFGTGPITGANAGASDGFNQHALIWSGSTASAIDIHPTNLPLIIQSAAEGTNGTQQVGYGMIANNAQHALVWNGTATAVDLNVTTISAPFGNFFGSNAYGTNGTQQVGKMFNSTISHAAIWTGSAASVVDLHPTQIQFLAGVTTSSTALAISGNQEAGFGLGSTAGNPSSHALIWSGTAASAVDMHPGGIYRSTVADATNGSQQAGYGTVLVNSNLVNHAMVWSGSSSSAFDLQSLLSNNFVDSTAYAINSAGDVSGIADDTSGKAHAVVWIAAPHVASTGSLGGTNVSITAAGRSPTAGDVHITLPAAGAGSFNNTNSLQTAQSFANANEAVTFALPGGPTAPVQAWDLSYSGTLSGTITLVFHYDESLLPPGTDESKLVIEHFTGGQWVALQGVVDTAQNLITVTTSSLSPFALAVAVPEPASIVTLMLGLSLLTSRKRRPII